MTRLSINTVATMHAIAFGLLLWTQLLNQVPRTAIC